MPRFSTRTGGSPQNGNKRALEPSTPGTARPSKSSRGDSAAGPAVVGEAETSVEAGAAEVDAELEPVVDASDFEKTGKVPGHPDKPEKQGARGAAPSVIPGTSSLPECTSDSPPANARVLELEARLRKMEEDNAALKRVVAAAAAPGEHIRTTPGGLEGIPTSAAVRHTRRWIGSCDMHSYSACSTMCIQKMALVNPEKARRVYGLPSSKKCKRTCIFCSYQSFWRICLVSLCGVKERHVVIVRSGNVWVPAASFCLCCVDE